MNVKLNTTDPITKKIRTREYEVLDHLPQKYASDFASQSNTVLEYTKSEIHTWISKEAYDKLNLIIGYIEDDESNAHSTISDENYLILVTTGMLQKLWEKAYEFVSFDSHCEVYKISTQNREPYIWSLFHTMVSFVIAHELSHIIRGHRFVLGLGKGYSLCEVTPVAHEEQVNSSMANLNWKKQLLEIDADEMAIIIVVGFFNYHNYLSMKNYSNTLDRKKAVYANFDHIMEAIYLASQVMYESQTTIKKKKLISLDDFDSKQEEDNSTDLKEIFNSMRIKDHPSPGIRFHCSLVFIVRALNLWGYEPIAGRLIDNGTHGIISYENKINNRNDYSEIFFSIGDTKEGKEYIRKLFRWRKKISADINNHALVKDNGYINRPTSNLPSELIANHVNNILLS